VKREVDVFVAGGGPAGLAAALAARQHGLQVVVADSMAPPIDKACGEGLMPDAVAALAKLGVEIPRKEAFPFRGIRFVSGRFSVEAEFPSGEAVGIRRTALHQLLVERATAAGVQFLWQSVVHGITSQGARVGDGEVDARWVVGADGSHSQVRKWAGLDHHLQEKQRFAFRRHYRVPPWTDFMELHWAPGCQLYVTPVAAEEVCVAVISRDSKLRLDEAMRRFPRVRRHLRGKETTSAERGAATVMRRLKRVCSDRVALVGDASGGLDAITGEGLCLAFRQASELATCFMTGNLKSYQRTHRRIFMRPAIMGELMLLLERQDWLRGRVMRTFEHEPSVFARMLATHVGASSTAEMASGGMALGWGLLFT
jgi:flavin-dependent dehydrogenase